MKIEKGVLKKNKTSFMVALPAKKGGTVSRPIPEVALRFRAEDAADGIDVEVDLDDKNNILKVTIPGKAEVGPRVSSVTPQKRPPYGGPSRKTSIPEQPQATRKKIKAPPSVLGLPFTNPYTFLPFSAECPRRSAPTPLSIDELPGEQNRVSGILELSVTTKSPLLTCHPEPLSMEKDHKTYKALAIGSDIVVPATGIRGALRTLLTALTGGTLGYVNQHTYLCQGRDLNLGPRGPSSPPNTPARPFLAEVVVPGSAFKDGEIRLGETTLVRVDDLERCYGKKLPRGIKTPSLWVGIDSQGKPTAVSEKESPKTPWRLKVSGRPVNPRGKREGAFLRGAITLKLPAEIWAAYSGRYACGDRPELRKGDLVWLEPRDPDAETIQQSEDVRSIQWSRWGRQGQNLKEKIPPAILPDYLQGDALVDEVTDLFGQVATERRADAPAFAARLRPENLVFFDAANQVDMVRLAPLAAPHPGCIAFYRNNCDPDAVSDQDLLRGYKVYRTSQQRGQEAPWRYEVQGVYNDRGELSQDLQKMSKTCELLREGVAGTLRIAFRALSPRELALLLQTCEVPWRLGGGKPLGLGLCTVRLKSIIGEDGAALQVPGWTIQVDQDGFLTVEGWQSDVQEFQERVRMWVASQEPVANLRYPRAADKNNYKISRGGHCWFQRHASPRMVSRKGDGQREVGLESLHIGGIIKSEIETAQVPFDAGMPMVSGEILPPFDPAEPLADLLYGYDGFGTTEERYNAKRRVFLQLEAFDPSRDVSGTERSEGNQGKNAEFRKDQKQQRTKDG